MYNLSGEIQFIICHITVLYNLSREIYTPHAFSFYNFSIEIPPSRLLMQSTNFPEKYSLHLLLRVLPFHRDTSLQTSQKTTFGSPSDSSGVLCIVLILMCTVQEDTIFTKLPF
jgi:hypothetical protein